MHLVAEIARSFGRKLDEAIAAGGLRDAPLLLVGHSMGGLVARAYMNDVVHEIGSYADTRGGERVLRLFTLATPHHGIPLATDGFRDYLAESFASKAFLDFVSFFFWGRNCSDQIGPLTLPFGVQIPTSHIAHDEANRRDVRWDNNDGLMPGGATDVNYWLRGLNQREQYADRIVPYAGLLDTDSPELEELRRYANEDTNPYWSTYGPGVLMLNEALDAGTLIGYLDAAPSLAQAASNLANSILLGALISFTEHFVLPVATWLGWMSVDNEHVRSVGVQYLYSDRLCVGAWDHIQFWRKFCTPGSVYPFNDGLVPWESAAFLGRNAEIRNARRTFDDHDHGALKRSARVLQDLEQDLAGVVTNIAPSVAVTSPTSGTVLAGAVNIAAAASDDVGIARVEFFLDGLRIGSDATSPYSWEWNTEAYANGSHSIRARAVDVLGQDSWSTAIDVTTSNVSANSPPGTPTALVQRSLTSGLVVPWEGNVGSRALVMEAIASDIDNDVVQLEVELQPVGGSFNGAASPSCASGPTTPSGGIVVATCSGLSDGSYRWQARARDSSGAASSWQSAGGNSDAVPDFVIAAGSTGVNNPPSVALLLPNGGETWEAGSVQQIRWTASDQEPLQIGLLYSTDGGATLQGIPGATLLANTGSFEWTVPGTLTSRARVSVLAMDGQLVGVDRSDANFSIVASCSPPSAPSLSVSVSSNSTVSAAWSTAAGALHYELQEAATPAFADPSNVYAGGGTGWASSQRGPGSYHYRVRAVNSCGAGAWSASQPASLAANQSPGAISAIGPPDGATGQPRSLTLSWSAGHPGGEGLRFNVYVAHSDNDFFYPNLIRSAGQTGTSFQLSKLPYNSTISWGVEAIDDSGDRRFSQMFKFTTVEDTTAPTGSVSIEGGAPSTLTYSVRLDLTAADAESGVREMRLSNDGANWSSWMPYAVQHPWNLATWTYGGRPGRANYTVYAQFRDFEGNISGTASDSIAKTSGTPGAIILNGQFYDSIQDAIDEAAPGDVVLLTEGVYEFPATVLPNNHPTRGAGLELKPGVALRGAGAEKTAVIVTEGILGASFAIVDADNASIEGMTIVNDGVWTNRIGVLLEGDRSTVRNCIVRGAAYGIWAGFGVSASNNVISHNVVADNSRAGIYLTWGSGVSVLHNTISGNLSFGLRDASSVSMAVANNIVTDTQGTGAWFTSLPSTFANNDVYGNTEDYGGGIADQTGSGGNISADPLLSNPGAGDYSLRPGSPAIDAGTDLGMPYQGSAPDMGALESGALGTVQVAANQATASFTIVGPNGPLSGDGMGWSESGLPAGLYSITFTPIQDHNTPPYQTSLLEAGQTVVFDGTYTPDLEGPVGTMAINFEEYATAESVVAITLDVADQVAGIGPTSEMRFSNDGATWSPAEPYSSLKSGWDLATFGGDLTTGIRSVHAQVSDVLGNWSTLTDSILFVPDRRVLEVPRDHARIQDAMDVAEDGDMVYVSPGSYDMSGPDSTEFAIKQGVRLQGVGIENTSIVMTGSDNSITLAQDAMIDGFDLTVTGGISAKWSAVISNNRIQGGISNGNGNGGRLIVRNNVIRSSPTSGPVFFLSSNCLTCATPSALIQNNVIAGGSDGIYVQGSVRLKIRVDLENSILIGSGTAIRDVHSDASRQHVFPRYNIYWDNGSLFQGNIPGLGPGDLQADPVFVDAPGGDYHLAGGSPGIDSGAPEAHHTDPDGTRNDRGAFGGPARNTPPRAEFSVSPPAGSPSTIFALDANLSHDAESADAQLLARWDLDGDGTYDTPFSANKLLLHRFEQPGSYPVVVQIKDGRGAVSTAGVPLVAAGPMQGGAISQAAPAIGETIEVVNQPPHPPGNPGPVDASLVPGSSVMLSWTGGDPDLVDIVTYDVYFGTTPTPPLVGAQQPAPFFDPGALTPNTAYFWQVVAMDGSGAKTAGPTWSFVNTYSDVDGDNVADVFDAFPMDPAASVDTDGDGYPNAWNPGMTESDSTTGLTLDAFPGDPLRHDPPGAPVPALGSLAQLVLSLAMIGAFAASRRRCI